MIYITKRLLLKMTIHGRLRDKSYEKAVRLKILAGPFLNTVDKRGNSK